MKRIEREKQTIKVMLEIYCKNKHKSETGLCPVCGDMLKYAWQRLDKCQFGEQKPTCANCRVHCYKQEMRKQVKEVMRFSGPKMLLAHPYLAIMHLLEGRRK